MLTVRSLVAVIIAVITTCVVVMMAPPGPASAGGPTSVILTVPGEGRTTSLYYSDDAYEELAGLLDADQDGTRGTVDRSGRDHAQGAGVTVTWLIHDVEPWRVDTIYLQGEGAPWIATREITRTGTIWDSPVVWHQPADAAALTELLDRLGVGTADGPEGENAAAEMPHGSAGAATAPVAQPPASQADGAAPVPALRWGVGGLLVGLVLAAAWRRMRSARADHHHDSASDAWEPDAAVDRLAPMPRT